MTNLRINIHTEMTQGKKQKCQKMSYTASLSLFLSSYWAALLRFLEKISKLQAYQMRRVGSFDQSVHFRRFVRSLLYSSLSLIYICVYVRTQKVVASFVILLPYFSGWFVRAHLRSHDSPLLLLLLPPSKIPPKIHWDFSHQTSKARDALAKII